MSEIRYYNVKEEPFELYGVCRQNEFARLPDELIEILNEGIAVTARESAGVRVRFATDSEHISICAKMSSVGRHALATLTATAGFDLYEDFCVVGDSRFIGSFRTPYNCTDGYTDTIYVGNGGMRYYTVYFPIHSRVTELTIGVDENAQVKNGKPYRDMLPIVIYGSSSVQGTGASRPGLTYTNTLSRRLNADVINLGFTGCARAEDAITDYIGSIDMSAFVCDYDYNAPSVEYLRLTHFRLYENFRAMKPNTPYIIVSRLISADANALERRFTVEDTYRRAKQTPDDSVYYINGESLFYGKDENEYTVDGICPNDLGHKLIEYGVECVIKRALN